MEFLIKQEQCIGCGLCANIAPDLFKMENRKARIIVDSYTKLQKELLNEALLACVVNAISVT